jgi:type IV fimbrial biogenesis protein FimT
MAKQLTRGPARQAGFNMLELMMTVFIAGIVLGVGVPSFRDFIATNRMAAATNDIVTAIATARVEAIKRRPVPGGGNPVVTMCLSANWNVQPPARPTCDLAGAANDGWVIFADVNANAQIDAPDAIIQVHAPIQGTNGIVASRNNPAGTGAYLQFGSDGFTRAAVGVLPPWSAVQLCDGRGNKNTGGGVAAGRLITIPVNGPGHPNLYRMQADVQGAINPIGGCP